MKFQNPHVDVFVPDNTPLPRALERTTHLGIGAHQDDIEFGVYHGISECFQNPQKWFTAVILTDGSGSARTGPYAGWSNERMQQVRLAEQRKAAVIGEYGAAIQLGYPSSAVKSAADTRCLDDLAAILDVAQPEVVYTHNPADKHDTHVAVFLRTLAALRRLSPQTRPRTVLGYETWRDLDWLVDGDKVVLPLSQRPNLQAALNGVFDSQISGGKRYDQATMGRRLAHATFFESHNTDTETALTFAMNLTPLIEDDSLDPTEFTLEFVRKLQDDIRARLAKLS